MIRLSRKAHEAAANLAGQFDEALRHQASLLALHKGKEFADESDVAEAHRLLVEKLAVKKEEVHHGGREVPEPGQHRADGAE